MTTIAERRKFILDSIFKDGFVKVANLADVLQVTQATIRKDLTYLEGQGLLYRAYGSALPTTAQVMDISLNTKKLINFKKKQRIAARADAYFSKPFSLAYKISSTTASTSTPSAVYSSLRSVPLPRISLTSPASAKGMSSDTRFILTGRLSSIA